MRKYLHVHAIMLSLLPGMMMLFSCTEEMPVEEKPEVEFILENKDHLQLELSNMALEKKIGFTTNVPWHASVSSSGKEWLSVSPTSGGSGKASIVVEAQANETYESRSAEISLVPEEALATGTKADLVAPDAKGITIKVSQDQKDVLCVDDKAIELTRLAQTFKVKVGHNIDYEVTIQSEGDWLTKVPAAKAYVEEMIGFSVTENTGLPREGLIEFTPEKAGEIGYEVLVKQAGIEEKLELECVNTNEDTGLIDTDDDGTPHFRFNSVKQHFIIEVTANNNYSVHITKDEIGAEHLPPYAADENYQWFEWDKNSEKAIKEEVSAQSFYLDYNGGNGLSYDAIERHVTIRFVSEYGTIEKAVRVTQTPATKIEISADMTIGAEGGLVEIPFRNNSEKPEDYRIELPADVDWIRWIKPEVKTKAAMTEVVAQLELDENQTQQDREAVLRLHVGSGDGAEFRILQKCHPFLKVNDEGASKPIDGKGGEISFSVTGNVDYTIDYGGADWIVPVKEEPEAGEEGKGLVKTRTWKYTISANNTPDKRTAEIKVVHADFGTSFRIVQYPDFAPDQVLVLPGGGKQHIVEVPWEGGEIRVPIQYCAPIYSTIKQDWVRMLANPSDPEFRVSTKAEGIQPTMEKGELVFQVQSNDHGIQRECMIDLYHDGTYYWNDDVPHWEVKIIQAKWVDERELYLKEAMQKIYTDLNGVAWSRQGGWKEASGDWRGYDHVRYSVVNGNIDDFQINISDHQLKGKLDIEHFPDVTGLEFWGDVTGVRLIDAPNLERICINTTNPNINIDNFEIRNCPELQYIVVNGKLSDGQFNVTECPNLVSIQLTKTLLRSMDFRSWPKLRSITVDDAPEFHSLNVAGLNELTYLCCFNSRVTSIDCSRVPELNQLNVGANESLSDVNVKGCLKLSNLNISGTPALRAIDLNDNSQLSIIDLSLAGVEVLDLSHSQVRYIVVNATPSMVKIPNLRKLDLHGSPINRIDVAIGDDQHPAAVEIDVHDCPDLYSLQAEADRISMNASGCTNLNTLNLTGYFNRADRYTEALNVEGCDKLTTLAFNAIGQPTFEQLTFQARNIPALEKCSISGVVGGYLKLNEFTKLQRISMKNCQLDSIDCSGMTSLEEFSLTTDKGKQSKASAADFMNCDQLFEIYLQNAQLHTIHLEGCTNLTRLNVSDNALKDFGTAELPQLESLFFENNVVEKLSLELYPVLHAIYCKNNRLNMEFTKEFWQRIKPYGKSFDVKYRYYQEYDSVQEKMVDKTEIRTYGWWFPGEPGSRSNSAPAGW